MEDWDALARALRTLHAGLLRRARADYIRDQGLAENAIGPGELLMLATRDEAFGWLRSLSELMTEVDELREDAAARQDPEVRAAVKGAVESLLAPPAEHEARSTFHAEYWRHVHDDPEVTMAHAAVRQALQSWPEPAAARTAMDTKLQAQRKRPH